MSLFSGGGVFDYAVDMTGKFNMVFANELDKKISAYYKVNNESYILNKNILEVTNDELPSPNTIDWLHASPPCQSFSIARAGSRPNISEDERFINDMKLVDKTLDIIKHVNPKFVTFENVPKYLGSPHFQKIKETLTSEGYCYEVKVIDAKYFFTPQSRVRLIALFAKDLNTVDFPEKLHDYELNWYDALHGRYDPRASSNVMETLVAFEPYPRMAKPTNRFMQHVDSHNLIINLGMLFDGTTYNFVIDSKPSKCLMTDGSKFCISIGRKYHRLNSYVYRRLFGLPDEFIVDGYSNNFIFKVLGNGVAAGVAEMLSNVIYNYLEGLNDVSRNG